MASELTKYLLIIGLVSTFECINAAGAPKLPPDPLTFSSADLNPEVDVTFWLYTTGYPDKPVELHIGDSEGLSNSGYDTNKPTKFVTHGWKEHANAICVPPIRKGFLKHGFNVVVVEWKRIATTLEYADAAVKVLGIAKYFAEMINFLIDQGSDPSQMTVAGHSLGGHIAGLAAHNAKSKMAHVVALDPAQPGFTKQTEEGRVDKVDASLVEIIHTDTRKLGFPTPIGNIDYFPNGGEFQNGCKNVPDPMKKEFCAHLRSCLYYAESLTNPDQWKARQCDNYKDGQCDGGEVVDFARWTNDINNRPDGTYYLRTNDNPPFGLGEEGTQSA